MIGRTQAMLPMKKIYIIILRAKIFLISLTAVCFCPLKSTSNSASDTGDNQDKEDV